MPKTNEELVEELPTNVCLVCGGDGFTIEHDPRDPTGQTPMQGQCDFCHAEGRITTLDVVRTSLATKDAACEERVRQALAHAETISTRYSHCDQEGRWVRMDWLRGAFSKARSLFLTTPLPDQGDSK